MKAAVFHTYGGPIEIVDAPKPKLLPDSVMIEVHAASVNPVDNLIRAGYMKGALPLSFPFIMGFDVSGVVTEVGERVTKFIKGDAVFARPNSLQAGTIAEYTMVKENELAFKPKGITHLQAAAIPLAGLTAWQGMVVKGHLKKEQKVLIHAGSGGVGTLAIQIAKYLGAKVATTTSTENIELVRSLGADVVIDYKKHKFEEQLHDYDLAFDMLGGAALENSFKVVRKGGYVISIKDRDTKNLAQQYGVHFEAFLMWPSGEMLSTLAEVIDEGKLKPVIDRTYPLDQTSLAYDHLQSGRAKGKIVIQVK